MGGRCVSYGSRARRPCRRSRAVRRSEPSPPGRRRRRRTTGRHHSLPRTDNTQAAHTSPTSRPQWQLRANDTGQPTPNVKGKASTAWITRAQRNLLPCNFSSNCHFDGRNDHSFCTYRMFVLCTYLPECCCLAMINFLQFAIYLSSCTSLTSNNPFFE